MVVCKRYEHYFSETDIFISSIHFGQPCPCPTAWPHPAFVSATVICEFLLSRYTSLDKREVGKMEVDEMRSRQSGIILM